MNIYDIDVLDNLGNKISMSSYKGKVILIVNTATGCGFTPQYEGLEAMYRELSCKGFEILDFPCNQFLNQAPASDEEINEFCIKRYNTTFKRFKKIDVNGINEDPLYTYLKSQKRDLMGKKIKWNFTKFLVDRDGKVVKRFAPTKKLIDIYTTVIKYL